MDNEVKIPEAKLIISRSTLSIDRLTYKYINANASAADKKFIEVFCYALNCYSKLNICYLEELINDFELSLDLQLGIEEKKKSFIGDYSDRLIKEIQIAIDSFDFDVDLFDAKLSTAEQCLKLLNEMVKKDRNMFYIRAYEEDNIEYLITKNFTLLLKYSINRIFIDEYLTERYSNANMETSLFLDRVNNNYGLVNILSIKNGTSPPATRNGASFKNYFIDGSTADKVIDSYKSCNNKSRFAYMAVSLLWNEKLICKDTSEIKNQAFFDCLLEAFGGNQVVGSVVNFKKHVEKYDLGPDKVSSIFKADIKKEDEFISKSLSK